MKNILILFVAYCSLLVVSCKNEKSATKSPVALTTPSASEITPNSPLKIAWVQIDSVMENYDYYKKIKNSLTSKGKTLDKDLETRSNALKAEYEGYQARGASMSPKQLQEAEMSLMKKQKDLEAYKNKQAGDLMKEEEALNKKLLRKIEAYLAEFAKENSYTFILSKHAGGSLLYGPSDDDVTKQITKGLNAKEKK